MFLSFFADKYSKMLKWKRLLTLFCLCKVNKRTSLFREYSEPFLSKSIVGSQQRQDISRDDWIKWFIKQKWSSGLFWAVGAAEKKNTSQLSSVCNFLRWFFQLFVGKNTFLKFFKDILASVQKRFLF